MSTEVLDLWDLFDELRVIRCAYIDSCLYGWDDWVTLVDVNSVDRVAVDFADVEVSGVVLHR